MIGAQPSLAGRFKLKSHVYFGKVDDGTWFEAGNRSFLLRNPQLYPVAEKCVALLDAGHPVETIMARAPDAVRPLFATLLASLIENDMVQAIGEDYPWPRPRPERVAADELLKMLEDRLGGAALSAAVARWHGARIAVVGHGHALKAAAAALAAADCRHLHVHIEDAASRVTAAEITAHVTTRAGDAARVQFTRGVPVPAGLAADLVVYASDSGDADVARRCAAIGTAAIIAGVFAGHACVAPPAEADRPGVDDMLHWLPAADDDAASHGPTSLAILGCVAAQAAIHGFFGFDADQRRGRVSVVGPDLQVTIHPLVMRGAGAMPLVHAPRHQLPDERTLETFEIVKLALDPWFDPLFGALRVVAADDIRQMPLLQYPVAVRRPGDAAGDALVVGWGLDLGQAGMRAIAAAVAVLAAPLLPGGATFAVGVDTAQWQRAALVAAVVASDGFAAGQRAAWLPVETFDDGAVRVLRRLIRYHSAAPLRARLHWSDLGPAYGVEVWLGEAVAAAAIGDHVVAVLAEALGRACSDFQLAESLGPGFWRAQGPTLSAQLPPSGDRGDWREVIAGAGNFDRLLVDYVPCAGLGLPPALMCGHAVLRGVR